MKNFSAATAFVTASIVTTAAALPAFAGNVETVATEPAIVPSPVSVMQKQTDWTGFYGGAQIGYGELDSAGLSSDGALGGVHAGYNHDFGSYVLGGELEYNSTNLSMGAGVGELNNTLAAKFRAGMKVGTGTLLYGTVGAVYGDGEILGVSQSDWGYLVGVGVEQDLGNNWSVGGEYAYQKFDNIGGTGVDLTSPKVSARVSYRF